MSAVCLRFKRMSAVDGNRPRSYCDPGLPLGARIYAQ
jgi:hypothetical protein